MQTFEGLVDKLEHDRENGWWQVSLHNESGPISLTATDSDIKRTLEDAMNAKRNVTVTYEEVGDTNRITSAELTSD